MWNSHISNIDPQTTKYALRTSDRALPFREVNDLWQTNADFRTWFSEQLRQSPFGAFFWETPPVTTDTVDRNFEFVLVDSPILARVAPDPSPFQAQFAARRGEEVITFSNLGGDAVLVVPAPVASADCYPNLARFLRHAPSSQVDSLWRSVGQAMQERLGSRPTWLSTAGLGVSWLHVRLDSRPKYYRYAPYKARS